MEPIAIIPQAPAAPANVQAGKADSGTEGGSFAAILEEAGKNAMNAKDDVSSETEEAAGAEASVEEDAGAQISVQETAAAVSLDSYFWQFFRMGEDAGQQAEIAAVETGAAPAGNAGFAMPETDAPGQDDFMVALQDDRPELIPVQNGLQGLEQHAAQETENARQNGNFYRQDSAAADRLNEVMQAKDARTEADQAAQAVLDNTASPAEQTTVPTQAQVIAAQEPVLEQDEKANRIRTTVPVSAHRTEAQDAGMETTAEQQVRISGAQRKSAAAQTAEQTRPAAPEDRPAEYSVQDASARNGYPEQAAAAGEEPVRLKADGVQDNTVSQLAMQHAVQASAQDTVGTAAVEADPAPLYHAAPAQQLAEQINESIRQGRKEFTLDLYPREMGKVSVKLVSQSGMLTVEIAAANPKTQSLLLSNADEIKLMLQPQQPTQVVDAGEQKQWYDQQQNSGHQQQQQQQERERGQQQRRSEKETFTTDDFLTVMQNIRALA